MRLLFRTALAIVLALPALVVASPAHAATINTWLNGVKVAGVAGNASSFLGDINRTSCIWRAYAVVVYEGDYVYIRDDCADGISATAWVQWKANGNAYNYYCVNTHGAGTYARCNLDWPESGTTVKMFVAGLKTPSPVAGQWQWGNWTAIYD